MRQVFFVASALAAMAGAASAQPTSWTIRNSGTSASLLGAAHGPFSNLPRVFFVVGTGGTVTLSTDGANWSASSVRGDTYFDVATDGAGVFKASAGAGVIDSFGGGFSMDHPNDILWSGIAYSGGVWSAVGGIFTIQTGWQDANTRSTNNGANWQGPNFAPSCTLCTPNDVAAAGSQFVAVYGDGTIRLSSDGISFTTVHNGGARMNSVTTGNGVLVAVGSSGRVCRSTDGGFSWTSMSIGATLPALFTVTYGGGYFVAAGQNGSIFYSSNGASWTAAASPTTAALEGAAYGAGTWILTGEGGVILQASTNGDLAAYAPPGWTSGITAAHVTGTNVDEPLTAGRAVFADFAWANFGASSVTAVADLYLDGVLLGRTNTFTLPAQTSAAIQDLALGNLSEGTHRLRLELDPTGTGIESNEGNNSFSRTFTVSAPPCTSDFNGDGDFGTDADIEAFFACLGGACCATCGSSDFNRDGDFGTDADIEAFFRVMGGGNC